MVTSPRSPENYLHPAAIEEVGGIDVICSASDCVASAVVRACTPGGPPLGGTLPEGTETSAVLRLALIEHGGRGS